MTCSFDTMLTTVLTSFILYLIVSFLFINSKRILIVGYRTVVYICLLSILRLVLSIEFSFSVHINLNTFFSRAFKSTLSTKAMHSAVITGLNTAISFAIKRAEASDGCDEGRKKETILKYKEDYRAHVI